MRTGFSGYVRKIVTEFILERRVTIWIQMVT